MGLELILGLEDFKSSLKKNLFQLRVVLICNLIENGRGFQFKGWNFKFNIKLIGLGNQGSQTERQGSGSDEFRFGSSINKLVHCLFSLN